MAKTHCFFVLVLLFGIALACRRPSESGRPTSGFKNRIAGTWAMLSANATTDGVTVYPYGTSPTGLLIFTENLYFAEALSVDPSTLPRFVSSSDRSSGTAEQNAAVVAGTLGQEGTYTVDGNGNFESNVIRTSTFPNYVGAARNTSAMRLEVDVTGQHLTERLQDIGSPTLIMIEYKRVH